MNKTATALLATLFALTGLAPLAIAGEPDHPAEHPKDDEHHDDGHHEDGKHEEKGEHHEGEHHEGEHHEEANPHT